MTPGPDPRIANADRERDELSARKRAVYQDRAQEERDRNSLMMILTTSRPNRTSMRK
jgi:hypothetical protein